MLFKWIFRKASQKVPAIHTYISSLTEENISRHPKIDKGTISSQRKLQSEPYRNFLSLSRTFPYRSLHVCEKEDYTGELSQTNPWVRVVRICNDSPRAGIFTINLGNSHKSPMHNIEYYAPGRWKHFPTCKTYVNKDGIVHLYVQNMC